ncbi:hypothetical protein [Pseudonocardia abyssalis]|jgi:hypothetical protein|uniref:Uncharacterized protein n=1 Tax=Pseudonocardia abyssalis TaxID=2792008 RepID=A0ABS6USJ3_9PSEU|nr:hypothetical protein [Pseudonocardia abyssalis]MBW0118962.1 hypothetical protein [Pseudonocardia abyssalis]MBW0135152.1 hypothetical protein [Pseudonocardia abyssalis]
MISTSTSLRTTRSLLGRRRSGTEPAARRAGRLRRAIARVGAAVVAAHTASVPF